MSKMHKLQYQRKRRGLSQEDMAKKLKMSTPGYQKYENGQRKMSIDTAKEIIAILGVSHIEDIMEDAS